MYSKHSRRETHIGITDKAGSSSAVFELSSDATDDDDIQEVSTVKGNGIKVRHLSYFTLSATFDLPKYRVLIVCRNLILRPPPEEGHTDLRKTITR